MAVSRGINNCYLDGHVSWIPSGRLDLTKHYQHSHWKYSFNWD